MFKLCLDNGLPAKPYKFVDHFDDYEETDEYKNGSKERGQTYNNKKIIVISFHEVDGENEKLQGACFVNNQLWIILKEEYLVCEDLSEKTKEFMNKNNTISLGFFNFDTGMVDITREIVLEKKLKD